MLLALWIGPGPWGGVLGPTQFSNQGHRRPDIVEGVACDEGGDCPITTKSPQEGFGLNFSRVSGTQPFGAISHLASPPGHGNLRPRRRRIKELIRDRVPLTAEQASFLGQHHGHTLPADTLVIKMNNFPQQMQQGHWPAFPQHAQQGQWMQQQPPQQLISPGQ